MLAIHQWLMWHEENIFVPVHSVCRGKVNGQPFFSHDRMQTSVVCLQVGPSATRAFDDFLHRLLCKSVDLNGQNLKELLLKIVYQLTADK